MHKSTLTNTLLLLTAVMLATSFAFSRAHGSFAVTSLVSFNGTNGSNPRARLAWGADGNLYGTTLSGGQFNLGTVFRMTPAGSLLTLASFDGTNGAFPRSGLTQISNSDFAFYGTAFSGGASNFGTAFKLTTNGSLIPLFSFAGTNGAQPQAGLILSGDGNFYGTTYYGGTNDWPKAYGTVFKMTTNGTLTTLLSFNNNNGAGPSAGLTEAGDGIFYGTTQVGGPVGFGTIFKHTLGGPIDSLATFNSTNGSFPVAELARRGEGEFLGTTYSGGASNLGALFRITTNGFLTNIVSFRGSNGAGPVAGLIKGADGNFYGTASQGGDAGLGTIFQVTSNGVFTTIFSFAGTNGAFPYASLVLGANGQLYGTTGGGGTAGNGTVFRLDVASRPPPTFQTITQTNGNLWLTWSVVPGLTYQLQSQTDLNQSTWSNFGGVVAATNDTITAATAIGPSPRRYYRVILLP